MSTDATIQTFATTMIEKMEAVWHKVDGTSVEVSPKNGTDFELEELQEYVGGYIEQVYLTDDVVMICNEEALILELPENVTASLLVSASIRMPYHIFGDVIVCPSEMIK